MEQNKEKKENKKIYIKFILLLAICSVAGYTVGTITNNMSVALETMLEYIKSAVIYIVPALFIGVNVMIPVIAFFIFRKAKKQADLWDGEDEEVIDRIENLLDIPMNISNLLIVFNYMFFSFMIEIIEFSGIKELTGQILFGITVVMFVLGLGATFLLMKKAVDLLKKLNPEKRGNVFDMQFQKVWVDSCDEAQKLNIYKAAYKAYSMVNMTCIALWVVCILAQLAFHTGVFPVICVTTIWLVAILSYSIEVKKLEHGKK